MLQFFFSSLFYCRVSPSITCKEFLDAQLVSIGFAIPPHTLAQVKNDTMSFPPVAKSGHLQIYHDLYLWCYVFIHKNTLFKFDKKQLWCIFFSLSIISLLSLMQWDLMFSDPLYIFSLRLTKFVDMIGISILWFRYISMRREMQVYSVLKQQNIQKNGRIANNNNSVI